MGSDDSQNTKSEASPGLSSMESAEKGDHMSDPNSSKVLDENYDLYKAARDSEIDPAEAKRVLRKIDLRVITILFGTYMLQYLDKNSINFSSVYGLQKGTNLQGNQCFQPDICCSAFQSAVIVMTTPACTNFAGIAANRFLLGAVEATVNPGFVLIMSIWYTNAEQPLRLEAYYCTNGIATMFGGLVGYAVGHINSGLPKWMHVFIIFGALSIAWGIVSLFVLPDSPFTAKFLSPHERQIAIARVSVNRQGVKNKHFQMYQAWQTIRDPKTWILFIMATAAQVPNSALTSFASIIIGTFGFDTLLVGGWVCSKWPKNTRCAMMFFANSICIIGAGLLVRLRQDNKWGGLVALWMCYFQGLSFSMSLTMVSSNVAGYTKKQLTAAILFTGYCVGNIIGPQTFLPSEQSTGYHSAYIAMLTGYSVKLAMVVVLYAFMWASNKARDKEQAARGQLSDEEEKQAIEDGMHDMTELDNRGFRYTL